MHGQLFIPIFWEACNDNRITFLLFLFNGWVHIVPYYIWDTTQKFDSAYMTTDKLKAFSKKSNNAVHRFICTVNIDCDL